MIPNSQNSKGLLLKHINLISVCSLSENSTLPHMVLVKIKEENKWKCDRQSIKHSEHVNIIVCRVVKGIVDIKKNNPQGCLSGSVG